jgi:hypothetical protein
VVFGLFFRKSTHFANYLFIFCGPMAAVGDYLFIFCGPMAAVGDYLFIFCGPMAARWRPSCCHVGIIYLFFAAR